MPSDKDREEARNMIDKPRNEAMKFARRIFATFQTFKGPHPVDLILEHDANIRSGAADEAAKAERATIQAEIANSGTSCHWCLKEAARKERERCAVRARSWIVCKRFDIPVGGFCYMSDVDELCATILTPESASEPKLDEHDLYVYDDAKPLPRTCEMCGEKCGRSRIELEACGSKRELWKQSSPRPVSAEDVETVREYVLSTIGSHHKPRERDILAALDRIAGKLG